MNSLVASRQWWKSGSRIPRSRRTASTSECSHLMRASGKVWSSTSSRRLAKIWNSALLRSPTQQIKTQPTKSSMWNILYKMTSQVLDWKSNLSSRVSVWNPKTNKQLEWNCKTPTSKKRKSTSPSPTLNESVWSALSLWVSSCSISILQEYYMQMESLTRTSSLPKPKSTSLVMESANSGHTSSASTPSTLPLLNLSLFLQLLMKLSLWSLVQLIGKKSTSFLSVTWFSRSSTVVLVLDILFSTKASANWNALSAMLRRMASVSPSIALKVSNSGPKVSASPNAKPIRNTRLRSADVYVLMVTILLLESVLNALLELSTTLEPWLVILCAILIQFLWMEFVYVILDTIQLIKNASLVQKEPCLITNPKHVRVSAVLSKFSTDKNVFVLQDIII